MKKSLMALAAQYALSKRISYAVLPGTGTHLYTMGVSHSL